MVQTHGRCVGVSHGWTLAAWDDLCHAKRGRWTTAGAASGVDMIDLATLMSGLTADGEGHAITVTEDWLQGRTIYGGLGAAICVESALRLWPLRSAQFAFIGPATGQLTVRPTILRRGKSTTFVAADLMGEGGLATRAMLCFGAARASVVSHTDVAMPQVARWDACPRFFPENPPIAFARHFDSGRAGPGQLVQGGGDPTLLVWLRHRGEAPASITSLVALADALPPAAMVKFSKPAPISTMTWDIDFLTERLDSTDGWWLVRSQAEHVADGYSGQAITLWNAAGEPVAVSRQNIAIFI